MLQRRTNQSILGLKNEAQATIASQRLDCRRFVTQVEQSRKKLISQFGKFYLHVYAAASTISRLATMQKSQHTAKYRRLLKALRQARKKAGLRQEDVARRLGTYASFVSKCESGERRFDVVELSEFCRIYGVALTSMLEEAGIL
jgi:ribosome-binding protein aMBF1 (putative translation factor)